MTDDRIVYGNALIAGFDKLGARWDLSRTGWSNNPQYHSSWDWLIPVMKKITLICKEHIFEEEWEAQWKLLFDYQSYCFFDDDIESVWEAAIKFIEWYNEKATGKHQINNKNNKLSWLKRLYNYLCSRNTRR